MPFSGREFISFASPPTTTTTTVKLRYFCVDYSTADYFFESSSNSNVFYTMYHRRQYSSGWIPTMQNNRIHSLSSTKIIPPSAHLHLPSTYSVSVTLSLPSFQFSFSLTPMGPNIIPTNEKHSTDFIAFSQLFLFRIQQ